MQGWDDVMWSWAAHQVAMDYREQERLLFYFMDSLTWWLQPKLRSDMEKEKQNKLPDAANYIQELRDAGASEEYIAKELAEMEEEKAKEQRIADLKREPAPQEAGGDDMEILRGPKS